MLPADFASRFALLQQERDNAQALLEMLEAHKKEYYKKHVNVATLPNNRFLFIQTVMGHVKASGLDINEILPSMPAPPPLDRSSHNGETAVRSFTKLYGFYATREADLNFVATATAQIAQDPSETAMDLINRFSRSVENNSSIGPFEATVFIVLMRSFKWIEEKDGVDKDASSQKLVIDPVFPLFLCSLLVNRTAPEKSYSYINWVNLLPEAQFWDIMRGVLPPIAPDGRIIDIGHAVARIKSFPLMPEVRPWQLNSWNTLQLNAHAGLMGSAAQSPDNLPPLKPFPIFKVAPAVPSQGLAVVGLEELNEVLESIPSGAAAKAACASATIDLRPLAQLIAQLIATQQPRQPRSNDGRQPNSNVARVK